MLLALGQGQGEGWEVELPKSWRDLPGKTAWERGEVMLCACLGCKRDAQLTEYNTLCFAARCYLQGHVIVVSTPIKAVHTGIA